MNFICRLFGHQRSIRRARRYSDKEWRSSCRLCGTPMVRLGPGKWIPGSQFKAGAEPEPPSEYRPRPEPAGDVSDVS